MEYDNTRWNRKVYFRGKWETCLKPSTYTGLLHHENIRNKNAKKNIKLLIWTYKQGPVYVLVQ